MIIGLMGNNGTGKSTLGFQLEKKLNDENIKAKYILGSQYFFLERILKIFGKNKINNHRKSYSNKERRSFYSLWPYIVYIDSIFKFLSLKFKKENLILDRYFYDFLITFEYLGYSNRIIRWLFLSIPKPDIAFLLDASPELAKKRKIGIRDFDLDYFYEQRERYLRLAQEKNIKVINTENEINETLNFLSSEISKYNKQKQK